jgi:hypothetical protein
MHARIASLSVLSASVIVLAGCAAVPASDEPTGATSTPSASSSKSLDAEPATGETFSGTGYSFAAPEGWTETAPPAGTTAPDVFVASSDASDGFADNVNVLIQEGVVTPDIVESTGVEQLSEIWKTDVEIGDRVEIAGEEVAHLAADMDLNGIAYVIDQYYLVDGEKSYIVTFSSDAEATSAERTALAESVLGTWAWE